MRTTDSTDRNCLLGFLSTLRNQPEDTYLLLPELREYAATELHPFQRLFCDLHVLVDGVHASLDLFELFCARTIGVILAGIKILVHSPHREDTAKTYTTRTAGETAFL